MKLPIWVKRIAAAQYRQMIIESWLRRQEHLRAAGRENAKMARWHKTVAELTADVEAADALRAAAARPL